MFSASTIGVSRFPNNATVRILRTETESKRLLLQSISNQSGSFSFRNSQCETGCNGNRTSEVFLQTPWFAIYLEVSFLKYKFMTLKTSECRSLLDKGVIVSPSRIFNIPVQSHALLGVRSGLLQSTSPFQSKPALHSRSSNIPNDLHPNCSDMPTCLPASCELPSLGKGPKKHSSE